MLIAFAAYMLILFYASALAHQAYELTHNFQIKLIYSVPKPNECESAIVNKSCKITCVVVYPFCLSCQSRKKKIYVVYY